MIPIKNQKVFLLLKKQSYWRSQDFSNFVEPNFFFQSILNKGFSFSKTENVVLF